MAPVFKNLKAWFSSSVSHEAKDSWKREGGREVSSINDANFIFTKDTTCPDTENIFRSEEFLKGLLAVFHVDYIAACLKVKTPHEVAAAKFIVLPPDMSDDVKSYAFMKCGLDQNSSYPSQTARREASFQEPYHGPAADRCIHHKQRVSDHGHTDNQNGNFVGGLEVQTSDVDFSIDDLESIPHVDSLPKVEGDIQDFYPGINGFSVSLKA